MSRGFSCSFSVNFSVTVTANTRVTVTVTASIRVRVCTGITVTFRAVVLPLSAFFDPMGLFTTSGLRLGERLRSCQYVCICDC